MKTFDPELVEANCMKFFDGDDLATNVAMTKYLLRNDDGEFIEDGVPMMMRRLSREFARVTGEDEEEIFRAFVGFSIIPQGSPLSAVGNDQQIMSTSNCFVVPQPFDSYGGILHADQQLAQIYKRRGGCGIDISTLRPRGAPTSNAAKTSDGIEVFMDRYSNTTRETAQSGRRGALLESVSIHHPDVEHFITAKLQKLDEDGNPLRDFNGNLIPPKVTGANISVRLTDEFMRAVVADEEYEQRFPVDADEPEFSRMINAREIWDLIIDSAWESAEPGLLFWDEVLKGPADAYEEFRSISTNPCVTGDALVQTSEGPKRVDSLVDKPFVAVYAGRTYQATGFWSNGVKPVYEMTTKRGNKVKLTEDHEVYVSAEKKVPLSELSVGDRVIVHNDDPEGPSWDEIVSIEQAGEEEVFDCTVDHCHRFSANGIVVSNCSEIPLCPYDSCRLMVTNLYRFVKNPFTEKAEFDFQKHEKYTRLAMRLMDGLIDLELEAIDRILAKIDSDPEPEHIKGVERSLWLSIREKCERGRRTGLGTTGLGDALAACGVRYGSERSIELVEEIYQRQCLVAYSETIRMAEEKGAFPAFDLATEEKNEFICKVVSLLSPEDQRRYREFGRRNIALLTNAPCGSISCLAQVTSGIEPAFLLAMMRNRKVTPEDEFDYMDESGDHWKSFLVHHKGLADWMKVAGKDDPEDSPYWGATANEIDWVASVELQAAAQRWICHAISKTCNLPADVSRDVVSDVYMKAWESGCKGFTVYRDGSRGMGVLSALEEERAALVPRAAPQRPETLPCDIHFASVKGEKFTIFVGLMDDRPYEVLGGKTENISIPTKFREGALSKTSYKTRPARYDLTYGEDGYVRDVVKVFDDAGYGTHTRLISLGLRHGAKPSFVVEQLQKDPDPSLLSFSRVIARVLKKYIEEGSEARVRMEDCETPELCNPVYEEGCVTCKQCGNSKCG